MNLQERLNTTLQGTGFKILIDYSLNGTTWLNDGLRNSGLVTPSHDFEKGIDLDIIRISHNPRDVLIVPRPTPTRGPEGLSVVSVRDLMCCDGCSFEGGGPNGADPATWVLTTTSGAVKQLRAATGADAVPGETYYGCAILELLTEIHLRVEPVLVVSHWFSPNLELRNWLLGPRVTPPPPGGWDQVTQNRMNAAGFTTAEHWVFLNLRHWRSVQDSLDVLTPGAAVYRVTAGVAAPPAGESAFVTHASPDPAALGASSAVSPLAPAPSGGGVGGSASSVATADRPCSPLFLCPQALHFPPRPSSLSLLRWKNW